MENQIKLKRGLVNWKIGKKKLSRMQLREIKWKNIQEKLKYMKDRKAVTFLTGVPEGEAREN